jgi:hypothetical protein
LNPALVFPVSHFHFELLVQLLIALDCVLFGDVLCARLLLAHSPPETIRLPIDLGLLGLLLWLILADRDFRRRRVQAWRQDEETEHGRLGKR